MNKKKQQQQQQKQQTGGLQITHYQRIKATVEGGNPTKKVEPGQSPQPMELWLLLHAPVREDGGLVRLPTIEMDKARWEGLRKARDLGGGDEATPLGGSFGRHTPTHCQCLFWEDAQRNEYRRWLLYEAGPMADRNRRRERFLTLAIFDENENEDKLAESGYLSLLQEAKACRIVDIYDYRELPEELRDNLLGQGQIVALPVMRVTVAEWRGWQIYKDLNLLNADMI